MEDQKQAPVEPVPQNDANPAPQTSAGVQPTPAETPAPATQPTAPTQQPAAAPTVSQPKQSQQKTGKSKRKLWLLVVVFILLVVAACLLYANHHKAKSQNSEVTKQDIPLIKYGFDNNPLNVFYPSDVAAQGPESVQDQIFEALVSYQNGTQIVPNLAVSWSNPNDTTWIFKLRPNVYYHDGDTVTAQDVIYSWQQVNQNAPAVAAYVTSTIKNITAINSSTVQITTVAPDAILLNRLAQMYILDSKAPSGTQPWELGTGAYTVKSGTTPSNDNLDLVAFNKWHGGHAYTRAIDYIFYANTGQAVADLESGKINLVDQLSLNNENNDLKQNYNVFQTPQIGVNTVNFEPLAKNSTTANIKIRQALQLAIDAKTVLTQSQQPGAVADQVVPPSVPGYNPAIKVPQQDISEAAALVKAAGYPNGVSITLGVGEPIASIAQEIAKEAKPAGININVEVATDEGQYFNTVNAGGYQAFIEEDNSSVLDGSDILGTFSGVPFYNNPTLDSQLSTASTTFDAAQRLKELQAASLTLWQDSEYIPLNQLTNINASNKNFVFPLNNYDNDLNVYFANVYQN